MNGATEASPWWGVPVIAGAFLLFGGLLTFLYTSLLERRRVNRELRRRWDADIRTTVANFVANLDMLENHLNSYKEYLQRRLGQPPYHRGAKSGIQFARQLHRNLDVLLPTTLYRDSRAFRKKYAELRHLEDDCARAYAHVELMAPDFIVDLAADTMKAGARWGEAIVSAPDSGNAKQAFQDCRRELIVRTRQLLVNQRSSNNDS